MRILVNNPHREVSWGWGFVVDGNEAKPAVTGRLRRVLPYRDAHQPFQELVERGVAVREVWFHNGRQIACMRDPEFPVCALEEWFELAEKNGPIELVYSVEERAKGPIASLFSKLF